MNVAISQLLSGCTKNFKKNWILQIHLRWSAVKNNKTIIRTLYIFKILYTKYSMKEAMSMFLWWSIYYFNNKWLLQLQFGLIVANQNKKTKIKTLLIFKTLYTGCPWKKQNYCFFHGAPIISRKKDFYIFSLVQTWQNKINKTRIRAI